MSKAKIGIVVPTLNSAATLDWTLCSLCSQRGLDAEVLVADSGSEDGTLDICKRWGVRVIYVPPGNMYKAINQGIIALNTEWVTYLNSDDLVYPSSYARLIRIGREQESSLAYGDCDFIDREGRFLYTVRSPTPCRLRGMFRTDQLGFQQAAAVFCRKTFDDLGGFDERYRFVSDFDFLYRLVFAGYKAARLQEPSVAAFRLHETQLSVRQAPAMTRELETFRKVMGVKSSIRDLVDVLSWRFRNIPTYAWRLMNLRRDWTEQLGDGATSDNACI